MPKSPKSDQNESHAAHVEHSNVGYCVLLAALPVFAALLPQLWVALLVPRAEIVQYLHPIPASHDATSPAVISGLYIYAVAASCTVVMAIASVWYSWTTLNETFVDKEGRLPLHIMILLAAAALLSALSFLPYVIDDVTTRRIFDQSGASAIVPLVPISIWILKFSFFSYLPFNWDSRILGFLTYLSFTFAAVTCAAAATSAPTSHAHRLPSNPIAIVRLSLFLTTGVLLAAMVTAKLRFDVALAVIGPAEKEAHHDYSKVAMAITSYWSVVLSLALAALYVPPTLALCPPHLWEDGKKRGPWFSFSTENLMRVLRLIAIVSPPLVAQVLQSFSA